MKTVSEIETALRELPTQERWEVARWLLEDLHDVASASALSQAPSSNGGPIPPLPDYSARRRRIFGNKVLPNMVLLDRAEERF